MYIINPLDQILNEESKSHMEEFMQKISRIFLVVIF